MRGMLRGVWLGAALVLLLATGCKSVYATAAAEHPEGALFDVRAGRVWGESGFVWTELRLANNGEEPVEVKPTSFRARDDAGNHLDFQAWSGFGGSRFTLATPRPIQPGRDMTGIIRWYPLHQGEPFSVIVVLGEEQHQLQFEAIR